MPMTMTTTTIATMTIQMSDPLCTAGASDELMKNAAFISHAIAIYVPTTNLAFKCCIYNFFNMQIRVLYVNIYHMNSLE